MSDFDSKLQAAFDDIDEVDDDEVSKPTQAKWGNVWLVKRTWPPDLAKDSSGNRYVTGREGSPVMLHFLCDCGRSWKMREDQFPGRRRLRNCGHAECPYAIAQREVDARKARRGELGRPKRPAAERGAVFTIYLPNEKKARVEAYVEWMALRNIAPVSRSQVCSYLIELGLKEVEDAMKAEAKTAKLMAKQQADDPFPDRKEPK